jgi:hypothetical protein
MPAIPLSANQVSEIVAFVKSRVAAADIRSANRTVQGAGDQLLTGNAEAGKAFFLGAGAQESESERLCSALGGLESSRMLIESDSVWRGIATLGVERVHRPSSS